MKIILKVSVLLLVAAALTACCANALKKQKALYEDKAFVTLAQVKVDCKSKDSCCSQSHLLKGDACFRLAKQGTDTQKNFDCAVKHLEYGTQNTKDWKTGKIPLDRDQFYANLCESLYARQNMESPPQAGEFAQQLFDTAKRFITLSPDEPAAVYYYNSARYEKLLPQVLSESGKPEVCRSLKEIFTSLNAHDDVQSPYLEKIRKLGVTVAGDMSGLPNCQP